MMNETENNISQPLDILMNQAGISNAALVNVSTEQLSFKMVQKGRRGKRLTSNVQNKILTALLKLKPELKLRCRDLFRYPADKAVVAQITKALSQIKNKKIKYPQFIDLLGKAEVTGYITEVAANRVTFFVAGGDSHTEQGPAVAQDAPGRYDEAVIRQAIAEAQKELIDHPTFLKKIHEAGIVLYEVNIRHRKIVYKGDAQSYRENIPLPGVPTEVTEPKAEPVKTAEKKPGKKKKKKNQKSMTTKARMNLKKRLFQRRKNKNKNKKK